jgi:hypothetical protein
VAVEAEKQVLDVVHVSGDLAVKGDEHLAQEEKDVEDDGVGDDLGQGLDLLTARVEVGEFADDEAQQDQQGRAGGKGRGQKARRQDGGQPEMAPGRPQYR